MYMLTVFLQQQFEHYTLFNTENEPNWKGMVKGLLKY